MSEVNNQMSEVNNQTSEVKTHELLLKMWVPDEPPKPPPAPVARFSWCPQQLVERSVENAVDMSCAVSSHRLGEVRCSNAKLDLHMS